MSDSESPPPMTLIEENQTQKTDPPPKKDFRLITKSGNELIKTIANTRESPDHSQIIKDGLEAVIREYVSVIVEKSDLTGLMKDEKYKFLSLLDVKSIFCEPGARKNPVTDKIGFQLEKTMANQVAIMKKLEVFDRLDHVSN